MPKEEFEILEFLDCRNHRPWLGGHRPSSGGAGWVSGHAGGCTLQGLTAWVFRYSGCPGRGQGGAETSVDMTKDAQVGLCVWVVGFRAVYLKLQF